MLRFVRNYTVKVHTQLTADKVRQLLATPRWSPTELLSDTTASTRAQQIDDKMVERLLQLSGLEANPEEYPEMISILKEQVRFIDHLYAVDVAEASQETHTGRRLTLEDIENDIAQLSPDASKGEVEGSWDPLSLASHSQHGHYVVREGLLKDK